MAFEGETKSAFGMPITSETLGELKLPQIHMNIRSARYSAQISSHDNLNKPQGIGLGLGGRVAKSRDWVTPFSEFNQFTDKVWGTAINVLTGETRLPAQVDSARLAIARLLVIAQPNTVILKPWGTMEENIAQKALMVQHRQYGRRITDRLHRVPAGDFVPIIETVLRIIANPAEAHFTKQRLNPMEVLTAVMIGIKKAGKAPLSPELSLKFLDAVNKVVSSQAEGDRLRDVIPIPFILQRNRELNLIRSFIGSVTPYLSNDESLSNTRERKEESIMAQCAFFKKSLTKQFLAIAKETDILDLVDQVFY